MASKQTVALFLVAMFALACKLPFRLREREQPGLQDTCVSRPLLTCDELEYEVERVPFIRRAPSQLDGASIACVQCVLSGPALDFCVSDIS